MGLVLIQIGMYKATVDNDIHFNQLEKESNAWIKYKTIRYTLAFDEKSEASFCTSFTKRKIPTFYLTESIVEE